MLGPLLRIGQQFRLQRLVLLVRRAAPPRARERADRHRAVAQAHQHLGARSHHGEAAEIEEEQERRRVDPPQRAVQRERRQHERHREALADHDLERVARGDVVLAPVHRGEEVGLGEIRCRRRRIRQHHRRRLMRQRPLQRRLRLVEPLLRVLPGRLGGHVGLRIDRRRQRQFVVHVVEDREQRRPHHQRLRARRSRRGSSPADAPSAAPCRSRDSRPARPPSAADWPARRAASRRSSRAGCRAPGADPATKACGADCA